MGGSGVGKSSGDSTVRAVLAPEQAAQLNLQNYYLGQQIPALEGITRTAGQTVNPAIQSAQGAIDAASNVSTGLTQQIAPQGLQMFQQGQQGLGALFDPAYEKNQINAALQAGKESARESLMGQNAMYGAAGGLGSSRQALADSNMKGLNEQRQATAAAAAQGQVQANKAQAAAQMMTGGLGAVTGAIGSNVQLANAASAPMDSAVKYAQVATANPLSSNFSGTQGKNSDSSSKGKGLSDLNAKQDIKKIGVLDNGINLYKYEYKPEFRDQWGHGVQVGVIAQEVEKIMPEAVGLLDNGFKAVDYSLVMQ